MIIPWARYPRPGACTCGNVHGCYEHGPQPRERSVDCAGCGRPTWTLSGVCPQCYTAFLTTGRPQQKG